MGLIPHTAAKLRVISQSMNLHQKYEVISVISETSMRNSSHQMSVPPSSQTNAGLNLFVRPLPPENYRNTSHGLIKSQL